MPQTSMSEVPWGRGRSILPAPASLIDQLGVSIPIEAQQNGEFLSWTELYGPKCSRWNPAGDI